MNDYELNRIGQMLQRSGDAFLSVLLQDLGCSHGTGTAYRNREVYIPLPPPTRDDRYYLVSMVTEGHNFPVAIHSRDRSFTILDSMFHEDSAHIMRVIEYLTGLGYTYVPHGCPVGRLPQQSDTPPYPWHVQA